MKKRKIFERVGRVKEKGKKEKKIRRLRERNR